jgi:hypothetical protein
MANEITKQEFDEIKNKTKTIICFENGKRELTYGGLSYKIIVDEIQAQQSKGRICVIVDEEVAEAITKKLEKNIRDRMNLADLIAELKSR